MDRVRSPDGTFIAFQRSGAGPPLVLVHGGPGDHTRWALVLAPLAERFTVYAMDRRGRGESVDTAPYALEREFEDVAAVVDAAGRQVNLLGHSLGALCAMEAAFRTPNLRKLILYEPGFNVEGIQMYPPGSKEKFEALLARGDREGLVEAIFRDIVGAPDEEIAALRADPSWPGRVAVAHTIVREMAEADYVFDPRRFHTLAVPTLLLTGEKSPPVLRKPTERLASALPHCRVVVLPGQQHVAMTTAPDLFLREVIGFLEA